MKKFTVLFIGLIFFSSMLYSQEIVVAGWTFPGSSAEADTGILINIGNEIYTGGGTSEIEFKNGIETKAAQATNWMDGMDTKYWIVEFSTEGYENLTISSKQSSGGNDPGPKDFKVQYSLEESGLWVDLTGSEITVENDWETGVIDTLELPEECNNLSLLKIRWIMISNEASANSGTVVETGKSKIDDIYIMGDQVNGISNFEDLPVVNFGPNPVSDNLTVSSDEKILSISIIDISGRVVYQGEAGQVNHVVNVSEYMSGVYFLIMKIGQSGKIIQEKICVR